MSAKPEMTDVFQFMELRAPFTPDATSLRRNFIYDDFVGYRGDTPDRIDADLQSDDSPSAIGRLVYMQVFCAPDLGNPIENLDRLIDAVLGLLSPYEPRCSTVETVTPKAFMIETSPSSDRAKPLSITELERHAHIIDIDRSLYYLLPERIEHIEWLTLSRELIRALEVMQRARGNFTLSKLIKELEAVFGTHSLRKVVFDKGIYAETFKAAKRSLFDTLYLLYILRRRTIVNLEHVIDGLRVLHVLEALSIDSLVRAIKAKPLSKADEALRETLEILFPELKGWNGSGTLPSLPLIQSKADFEAYFTATPVIHPIFARLHAYKRPFNDIKPIGVGDLKVVKQWLIAYLPGEISHIENVLKGEVTDRTHRRLEKTDESFSFSSDYKESSQKDTQSTERFELKREVENIVKTELSVGVNANLTYKSPGGMIISNVGANFSYKRDATDQGKTSGTFWRETLSKAVQQVEKSTSERRTVTKLFETEETNKHGFDNKGGTGHVTGIYRWLDKKYKAQLFNYGRRMMFEFVIPEPAAFFVESRLRAFESTLEIPRPPELPKGYPKAVSLGFTSGQIDKTRFKDLQQKYDLAEFVFPEVITRQAEFIDATTNSSLFSAQGLDSTKRQSATISCKLNNAQGFTMTKLIVTGRLHFWGKNEEGATEQNTFDMTVAGQQVIHEVNNTLEYWVFGQGNTNVHGSSNVFNVNGLAPFGSDDITLSIGFWDIADYELNFRAELVSGDQLPEWQAQVFNKIVGIEQKKVDKENQEAELAYNTKTATYRNRLAEVKATSVNELLQGQSEAFNREIIRTELKKHCLTMIMKEFDFDDSDDLLSKIDALQRRSDDFTYRKFKVTEDSTTNTTTASFDVESKSIDYPSIVLDRAKLKGRFIQFMEQAFEWQQLAYVFYPYFWTIPPRWIEMMSRSDDADANMTAFLQAGSVKVLLAVTPAYDAAVLHFIATREPWEGGPAPVIGDPLFIPLHEELRKQQDDLYNAVPEGEPWTFTLPTSLVYLDGSDATLPTFPDVP